MQETSNRGSPRSFTGNRPQLSSPRCGGGDILAAACGTHGRGAGSVAVSGKKSPSNCPQPDWAAVHMQLSGEGMTLERVWHNYRRAHPNGHSYWHFCALYDEWSGRHKLTMRLHRKAGEQLFVDYASDTIEIIDPEPGKVGKAPSISCSLWIAVQFLYCSPPRKWLDQFVLSEGANRNRQRAGSVSKWIMYATVERGILCVCVQLNRFHRVPSPEDLLLDTVIVARPLYTSRRSSDYPRFPTSA